MKSTEKQPKAVKSLKSNKNKQKGRNNNEKAMKSQEKL